MFSFDSPYNQGSFLRFLERDFLPHDFKEHREEIDEFSGNRIQQVKQIGEVPSLDDLVVFEIHHGSKHDRKHDPRVTLTRESFKLIERYGVKNALAAFVSDNSDNYRFSLITSSLTLTEEGQAKRDFSNPRRYSFLLGPDAKVKTPTMYLQEKGRVSDFEDLRERFDIRVLTKEFYNELSNWYFWALKNVKFPDGAEEQSGGKNMSVIRMITRLVFIWFMKERELVPDKLFSYERIKNTLNSVAEERSTYYKAILQNLFFATLNTKIKNRGFRESHSYHGKNKDFMDHSIYRYERFFQNSDEILDLFKGIPFLNGGIFECLDDWEKVDGENKYTRIDGFSDRKDNELTVPNLLFFGDERKVDLSDHFESGHKEKSVRGLINILNDYNFTIDENTPIDKEVSLDPELLGHIFENLLASYNPETATTARKATGSYYTPRPIVEFMTDESLKQYFINELEESNGQKENLEEKVVDLLSYHTEEHDFNDDEVDKLINSIYELKIIDPAVGSGAFPMGILQKLVLVLSKLDPNNRRWKQKQVEAVKQNVTDGNLKNKLLEEIEKDFQKNRLDYGRKLYLIRNSIYGVDIQPIAIQIAKLRFFISLLVDEDINDDLENLGVEPLPNLETNFVAANSLINPRETRKKTKGLKSEEIEKLENELRDIRSDYFNASSRNTKESLKEKDREVRDRLLKKLKKAIPNKDQQNLDRLAKWDPYDYNSSASFFDPDWMFGVDGFDIVIANPPYIKEYTDKSAFDGARGRDCYKGKMDIWYLFGCLGIDLLKQGGVECFIAQNNWVTSYGASKFRNKIIKETQIKSFVDFGSFKVFESSGINTMVYVVEKGNSQSSYNLDYSRLENANISRKRLPEFMNASSSNEDYKTYPVTIQREHFVNNYITFLEPPIASVVQEIRNAGNTSLRSTEAAQGIVCPQEDVLQKHLSKLNGNFSTGDGIFVISESEKKQIGLTEDESKIIKPYYTSDELSRYYGNTNNKYWIIYTQSDIDERIENYPNIKSHLEQFEEVITSVYGPYGLHRARDEKFFKDEAIISKRKCGEPTFTYTDFDCYVSQTFFVIKTSRFDLKYLTGLLNSKLIAFWLWYKGKKQGDQYQVDKGPLTNIPLPRITSENKHLSQEVRELVDNILEKKIQQPSVDIDNLESRIDEVVYQLYELDQEQIETVENEYKN